MKKKKKNIFLQSYESCIDNIHYEIQLHLGNRCITATIDIKLQMTLYDINTILILKAHCKQPLTVCNTFQLQSNVGHVMRHKYVILSILE